MIKYMRIAPATQALRAPLAMHRTFTVQYLFLRWKMLRTYIRPSVRMAEVASFFRFGSCSNQIVGRGKTKMTMSK